MRLLEVYYLGIRILKFMNKIINYFIRRKFTEMSLRGLNGKNKKTVNALWELSGDLVERFCERDSGEFDYNQEKIYFNLLRSLRDRVFKV